ncbi:aspartate/glutamate racemase family protein [Glutamicibacter endophyticus]|uniref:aspartate/glutamate racemase family protein n=1 Tax=Glutamicibacter endophyticus TaxID=1522174 RepID=UPI003AF0081C
MKNVVLLNPNTNTRATTMMTTLAMRHRSGFPPITVRGATVHSGPAMITEPVALAAAATAVGDQVNLLEPGTMDALIIAAFGDPGLAQLQHSLDLPVVGIGQSAILEAAHAGRAFALATTTPDLVDSLTEQVERYGCSDSFRGVFLTGDGPLVLAANPQAQLEQLREATRAAAARGAEAVVIAGGPLSDTARQLRTSTTVQLIEPVPAAIARVERMLLLRSQKR